MRAAVAATMQNTFVGNPVDPEAVVCLGACPRSQPARQPDSPHRARSAGAAAVLETLAYALCDADEAVMIPSPLCERLAPPPGWPDARSRAAPRRPGLHFRPQSPVSPTRRVVSARAGCNSRAQRSGEHVRGAAELLQRLRHDRGGP
jgi:hypothetical protein